MHRVYGNFFLIERANKSYCAEQKKSSNIYNRTYLCLVYNALALMNCEIGIIKHSAHKARGKEKIAIHLKIRINIYIK